MNPQIFTVAMIILSIGISIVGYFLKDLISTVKNMNNMLIQFEIANSTKDYRLIQAENTIKELTDKLEKVTGKFQIIEIEHKNCQGCK